MAYNVHINALGYVYFLFWWFKAYLANIPLKNKPTINKRLSATENHNHKNHMQQKWQKTTNQPTSLFFTAKMCGKSLKTATAIAIVSTKCKELEDKWLF